MFYKPYSGRFYNRNTGTMKVKCFTDECEWRYVPDVTRFDYQQVYVDKGIPDTVALRDISNSLVDIPDVALKFEYSDIKYIIVKSLEDFSKLMAAIESWQLEQSIEHELISKILVWDLSKGDF